MILFKSPHHLTQLPPYHPTRPIIEDLVQRLITDYIADGCDYSPADDGYIVLVQPGDQDRVHHDVWEEYTLLDIPWEGITQRDGHYIAVVLQNNQLGYVFVFPDEEWLDGPLRESILAHLDP
jgi:hypothetical protein